MSTKLLSHREHSGHRARGFFLPLCALCVLCGSFLNSVSAADNPIVPENAKLEKLWGEGEFTEGPACGPGWSIYFSDIGNRIMRYSPDTGKTTVYREPSGRANGLDFDPQGRLVAAEGANTGGNRRITITMPDGSVKPLAEKWNSKRFNSPNDLTIDTKGRIYFTDPRYVGQEPREIDTESVYRIDPDGTVTQIITDVQKPNGIVLSPDMKTLYVADSNPGGNQQLLSFPQNKDGSVGEKKIMHDFGKSRGIDGMSVDIRGNIYGAAGDGKTGGIYVFHHGEGEQLAFIPVPETPTNCVFGDRNRKSLYITAGKSLYRIKLKVEGFAVFWPADPSNLEGVNSSKDEDEPHLASETRLFYTQRENGKYQVMESVRKNSKSPWTKGANMVEANVQGDCRCPFVSEPGKYPQYFYFATNKDSDKPNERGTNFDIFFLTKLNAKSDFTTPTPLHKISTPADELHPWLSRDGLKLYFSRKDQEGWHVYQAIRQKPYEQFTAANRLELPVGFHHPTLTGDGKKMYLQGPLPEKRWGIFRSSLVGQGWSSPEPLLALNHPDAPKGDMSPALSHDGTRLFFASDRPGGKGGLDLWFVPTGQLGKK
jgi:gluconolactonase